MYETLNEIRKKGVEGGRKLLSGFELMTKNPMAVQTKLLLELLSENQDTEYGRKYGFADIHSIEEFQARLPIT